MNKETFELAATLDSEIRLIKMIMDRLKSDSPDLTATYNLLMKDVLFSEKGNEAYQILIKGCEEKLKFAQEKFDSL